MKNQRAHSLSFCDLQKSLRQDSTPSKSGTTIKSRQCIAVAGKASYWTTDKTRECSSARVSIMIQFSYERDDICYFAYIRAKILGTIILLFLLGCHISKAQGNMLSRDLF